MRNTFVMAICAIMTHMTHLSTVKDLCNFTLKGLHINLALIQSLELHLLSLNYLSGLSLS